MSSTSVNRKKRFEFIYTKLNRIDLTDLLHKININWVYIIIKKEKSERGIL